MLEEELRNVKPALKLIWDRLWNKDKWLTWSIIISIAIILLCLFVNPCSFIRFLSDCICLVSEGEPFFYTLAVSCLTGLIVYLVTTIIPDVRISRTIYVEVVQQLKKLEDDFTDFKIIFGVGNWDEDKDAIKRAVDLVKLYNRPSNVYYSLSFCKEVIEHLGIKIETLTGNVLTYTPYLAQKELDLLVDIRYRNITKKLIDNDGLERNLLSEENIRLFFSDLSLLNKDITTLKQWIEKRVYRKSKTNR